MSQNKMNALAVLLTALASVAPSRADEFEVVVESPTEIAAKAEVSASELATSLRSLDSSLLAAVPVAEGNRVLSTEEHDALVEGAMKAELAALANELDLVSASLSTGAHPAIQKALLDRVARRASILSRLGARPARVSIPEGVVSELLTLWRDVETLRATR